MPRKVKPERTLRTERQMLQHGHAEARDDVVSSAREVVRWDWLHLLYDCPDAETVREDVKRLDGALAALDEAAERGEHVKEPSDG